MFININIKSKNKNSLKQFLKIFKQFSNDKKLKLNQTLFLSKNKNKNKIFTILKSPHVNKTAQEQFKFVYYSKELKLNSSQTLKFLILLKNFQTIFFSDIQIKLNFVINPKKSKTKFINKFKPNNINLKNKYDINYKQIKLYLLLFHFYGKYKRISLNSSVGRAKD